MSAAFKPYPFEAKQYAARIPELGQGPEKDQGAGREARCEARREVQRHAVAIVGGGPVGLAVALGLARHGVRSVLIEADASVCYGSRAICISRRSLEIIERLGALDGFLAKGLPWTGGRSYYRSDEVLHFQMPQDENQKLPPMVNLAQYHIEQFLLDAAETQADLIDIRWQTKVTAMREDAHGATLQLSTPAGEYEMTAAAARSARRSA
jgi:3-(3-hydroxy-phenyl)propionate hydroxylase